MSTETSLQNFLPERGKRAHFIAGPCSAESEAQVLETAKALKKAGVDFFRAGVWKPRTRPGSFEGIGEEALGWLQKARELTGLKVITEVANPSHAELALKYGLDAVWLGARTTVNPFSVQEIVDALSGSDIPIFIKNPINPDVKLWMGAVERVLRSGNGKVAAIHRGFSVYGQREFRNPPKWQLAIELRRQMPELPLFCDSSHIAGNRKNLCEISQQALDLGYDGIHLEVHPDPDRALSDPEQQLTPNAFLELKEKLVFKKSSTSDLEYLENLGSLRKQIDETDEDLVRVLAERMNLIRKIGQFKKSNNVRLYQPERWSEILDRCMTLGQRQGVDEAFLVELLGEIHKESLREQRIIIHESSEKDKG